MVGSSPVRTAPLMVALALPAVFLFPAVFFPDVAGAQTMAPWTTRSSDNSRSGWNPHETVLTQATIGSKGLVRATRAAWRRSR
jgi:hypothetical protein